MRTLPPNLKIITTQDGSPTLSLTRTENGIDERMHHSAGALSESLYIYHDALKFALALSLPARVASLGLGLGYNEWIAIAMCDELKLWSFEQDAYVRQSFEAWLADESPEDPLHPIFAEALAGVALHFALSPLELKTRGVQKWRKGHWEMRKVYPQDSLGLEDVTCFFYDAFSKNWDPTLWQEDTLRESLQTFMANASVFATYASTGSLNRALKSLGFCLISKPGFSGKRESTLAIRRGFG